MKLEVKNIKHARSLSEETNAFSADLYVNKEKIATCSNNGHGGMTNILPLYSTDEKKRIHYRQVLEQAQLYANGLPKYDKLSMSLDFYVDLEVEKDLQSKETKKFINKLDKLTIKNLVVISKSKLEKFKNGEISSVSYRLFGGKTPIDVFSTEDLKRSMKQVELVFKDDEEFYNKNLPK